MLITRLAPEYNHPSIKGVPSRTSSRRDPQYSGSLHANRSAAGDPIPQRHAASSSTFLSSPYLPLKCSLLQVLLCLSNTYSLALQSVASSRHLAYPCAARVTRLPTRRRITHYSSAYTPSIIFACIPYERNIVNILKFIKYKLLSHIGHLKSILF